MALNLLCPVVSSEAVGSRGKGGEMKDPRPGRQRAEWKRGANKYRLEIMRKGAFIV